MQVNHKLLERSIATASKTGPRSIWNWLAMGTQILVFVAGATLIYLFFLPTFDKSSELKRELANFEMAIASAEQTYQKLVSEADALMNNPDYVARLSRDRLNLAQPEEIIFRFEPYRGSSSTPKTK